MGDFDLYIWSFTSSSEDILVLALTQEEYDAFYNQYLSDYSAFLNKRDGRDDSGRWRPHRKSNWHILYINTGNGNTQLTINDRVQMNVYFPWIPIILGIGIPSLICIGATIYIYRRKKRGKINDTEKKERYCTKCGTQSNSINKFCEECGTLLIP
jgi:hypothetical protein